MAPTVTGDGGRAPGKGCSVQPDLQLVTFSEVLKPQGEDAAIQEAVGDGGIILSRVTGDRTLLPKQLLLYRDLVRLIFELV